MVYQLRQFFHSYLHLFFHLVKFPHLPSISFSFFFYFTFFHIFSLSNIHACMHTYSIRQNDILIYLLVWFLLRLSSYRITINDHSHIKNAYQDAFEFSLKIKKVKKKFRSNDDDTVPIIIYSLINKQCPSTLLDRL